jgi:hypothetical protein
LQWEALDDASQYATRGLSTHNISGFRKRGLGTSNISRFRKARGPGARTLGTRKGYPYISGFGKFVVYVFTVFEDLLIVA